MSKENQLSPEELEAALLDCAREPVHIPGAIQPHGALISCDVELRRVRQVSANIETMVGISVEQALASSPEELIGTEWIAELRNFVDTGSPFRVLVVSISTGGRDRRFRLLPYRSGSRVVLELEPIKGKPERRLMSVLAEWQTRLATMRNPEVLLTELTALVRELAGYDRVMVYRFDEDWNGSVIAESRSKQIGSYLGHHFPAGDIPEQVRRLYSVKRVRDIPDATADPVGLVPEVDPEDDSPLDLSRGVLRAAAPIHCVYLANMGVVASMSIALHVGGRLWGLLACHGERPTVLPPELRDALRGMVQSTSFQVELIEVRKKAELIGQANDSRDLLLNDQGEFRKLDKILKRHGKAWLKVFRASGVALAVSDRLEIAGEVPDPRNLEAILAWLGQESNGGRIWASNELGATPMGRWVPPGIGGLLATPLPIKHSQIAWLLLFRQEKIRTRIWAGNPEKVLESRGGQISPRSSFKSWSEEVRGRSDAWMAVERRAAADLASDVAAMVAADEISRLNERLTQLASHDDLTGVWNRYRIGEEINQEIERARRYGRECCLMIFDIDHFKHFNDTFGHDAGDEVLVRVAEATRDSLRAADRVGRWGGEEFVVLAPETGLDDGRLLAERLRQIIEDLDLGDYGTVTVSIGVAVTAGEESRRDFINRADRALYAAKDAGRNRVEMAVG